MGFLKRDGSHQIHHYSDNLYPYVEAEFIKASEIFPFIEF